MTPSTPTSFVSELVLQNVERLFEVGKKIAPVLDAHGDADEAIGDAGVDRFFLGVAGMRSGPRMASQSFDAAERDGISSEAEVAQELKGSRLAAFQFQREYRARKGALGAKDQALVRVGKKRGVQDARNFGVTCQLFGDTLPILAGTVHAQDHGGKATIEHPAFIRLENIPKQMTQQADLLDQFGILGQDHAGEQVTETGKILGGGIEHEIRAESERMLKGGAEKGVVHHHQGAGSSWGKLEQGDRMAKTAEVRHGQSRVCGGLHKDGAKILR